MIPIPTAGTLKAIGLGVAVAAFLATGFYGGYKWQAGNVAEAEAAKEKAELARDRWQANAQSYKGAIQAQKDASEKAVKDAEAQKAKADKAIAEARAERDKYEKKLAQIAASVESDKLDPVCKAELERKVCGSPWH